jgi:hypothetical protein
VQVNQIYRVILILGLSIMLGACQAAASTPVKATPTTVRLTASPAAMDPLPTAESVVGETQTPQPGFTATAPVIENSDPSTAAPTEAARIPPEKWKDWPVVPLVSIKARKILLEGIANGNNPKAFSKVGDCETNTEWFLSDFDKGKDHYILGPYADLQAVIDQYAGSYGRVGVAALRGFTAASVLNPYWRDAEKCEKNETPLACELRLNKPAFALIMLGTNDAARPETFEKNLRAVIEAALTRKVLPVLATKADNLEGDERLNQITVRLAYEYDIPLWNFWRAVQSLPGHGLQEDLSHLTFAPNDFSDPGSFTRAWPVRNLTALQLLDAIRQSISQ